jgi:cytidine deaminase
VDPIELIQKARQVQQRAYAPYSKYRVGAALLGKSGRVYTGCNVENSSFGLTCCAERTALFKAISEGEKEFEAVAVVAPGKEVSLCGACRQVLWEFAPDLVVYGQNAEGKVVEKQLKDLLPGAFGPSALLSKEEESSS